MRKTVIIIISVLIVASAVSGCAIGPAERPEYSIARSTSDTGTGDYLPRNTHDK